MRWVCWSLHRIKQKIIGDGLTNSTGILVVAGISSDGLPLAKLNIHCHTERRKTKREKREVFYWERDEANSNNSKKLFSFLPVLPVKIILFSLCSSSWPWTKYFFPHSKLFQFRCLHQPANWTGSRAGSPVSQYVSLVWTLLISRAWEIFWANEYISSFQHD